MNRACFIEWTEMLHLPATVSESPTMMDDSLESIIIDDEISHGDGDLSSRIILIILL